MSEAMHWYHALLLGLLQGLGEFLPISSSGHLKLAEHFLGLPDAEKLLPFDVLLHLGTLLAVVAFFWSDLKVIAGQLRRSAPRLIRGGWAALADEPEARLGWLVLFGCVPTAAVAFSLRDQADLLGANTRFVACMLLVTGTLNWFADRRTQATDEGRPLSTLRPRDAIACGLAQGISAILRGVSRSGSTITCGLLLGLDREAAPRFSFLLAIPAVLGAAAVEIPKLRSLDAITPSCLIVGFITAAVTGYIAVAVVLKVAKQRRLRYFAYYCWTVGALALIALLAGA